MAFTLTRDELIRCGTQVQELRLPSVASLYGVHSDKLRPAELLGSGTFIQHRNDIFLLTAMHVLEQSQNYAHVFHDVGGDGENMVPFRDGWTGWNDGNGDLALWSCFREFFDESHVRPVPLVEPFGFTDASDDAFFIASGWPQDQALALPAIREYRTTLHTVMGKTVKLDNLPDHCFAFDCANDIRYYGMSGSAVWNLNLHRCRTAEEWTPQMSTFAGVVTRWDDKKGLIIATQAESVKRFLSGAIERLRMQWKHGEAGDEQEPS